MLVCLTTLFLGMPSSASAQDVKGWFEKELESILGLYLHLHKNPELSLHEKETSKRIAKELRDAGYEVTENVGIRGCCHSEKWRRPENHAALRS